MSSTEPGPAVPFRWKLRRRNIRSGVGPVARRQPLRQCVDEGALAPRPVRGVYQRVLTVSGVAARKRAWRRGFGAARNDFTTSYRYPGAAGSGEINICQQRLQVPYIPNVRLWHGGDCVSDKRKEGGVAMASLKIAAFALALLGSSMVVGQASAAMPVNGMTEASKQISSVDQVWCGRWRCGGYRWGYRRWGYRPYWGRPYWGRPYAYGWRGGCGWRRCWW
jgi:hypothetical protein